MMYHSINRNQTKTDIELCQLITSSRPYTISIYKMFSHIYQYIYMHGNTNIWRQQAQGVANSRSMCCKLKLADTSCAAIPTSGNIAELFVLLFPRLCCKPPVDYRFNHLALSAVRLFHHRYRFNSIFLSHSHILNHKWIKLWLLFVIEEVEMVLILYVPILMRIKLND